MPFITEELWQQMYERNAEEGESLMVSGLQKNIAQKEPLDLQVLGENPVAEFNAVIQKM